MYNYIEKIDVFQGAKTIVGIVMMVLSVILENLPAIDSALNDASGGLAAVGAALAAIGKALQVMRDNAAAAATK
jgi:hypothetical protein